MMTAHQIPTAHHPAQAQAQAPNQAAIVSQVITRTMKVSTIRQGYYSRLLSLINII